MILNWSKGDFEVRTVTSISHKDNEPYVELVKWNTDSDGRRWCYTLAYFSKSREGNVSLHFVGDRPFKDLAEIDINSVWKQLFLSQMMLEDRENED